MPSIVTQDSIDCNKYLSSPSVVSSATTRKVLSRDIKLLRRLKWFHSKGLYCYYTKEQWLVVLQEDSPAGPSYEAFKRRRQKLERLGLIYSFYIKGNRNRPKGLSITQNGLEALKNFKFPRIQNVKSDQLVGSVFANRDAKSDPATCKKRSDELQKVIRPLNHVERSDNHGNAMNELLTQNPSKHAFILQLIDWGIFSKIAYNVVQTIPREVVGWAYEKTSEKSRRSPGAYFLTLLNNAGFRN